MQDDVEIVARAICKADGNDPDSQASYNATGQDNGSRMWHIYKEHAQAAITATRTIDAAALLAECNRRGVSAHWPADWLTQRAQETNNG